MRLTIEDLIKRVAVLERKALREKKARNLAENQLELYSRDIYETNQSLQKALLFSKRQQAELEYLGKTSANVASECPLHEMTCHVVELTSKFCSAEAGFYVVTDKGTIAAGQSDQVWRPEQGWHQDSEFNSLINRNLPLKQLQILESWEIQTISHTEHAPTSFKSIVYLNVALSNEKIAWLGFLSHWEHIDREMLSVLQTSRGHLLSGVHRRLTDVHILKRNVQLQDSVNKLEKAKRQLIQSEKMASLGQLAAGVAHEINNPVAFVSSNMEVLKHYLNDYKILHEKLHKKLNEDGTLAADFYQLQCAEIDLTYIEEDSEDLLASNIDGLDRVKSIVDNLKSFSHSGDEEQRQLSLFSCVEAALKVANNVIKYDHQVNNSLTPSVPLIMGNAGQLQQVFLNLFVNSAYAMEGGGQLTISDTVQDGNIFIHVKDTGCGMDEKTVNKLFTPFFTTKPMGVGTGLGLSVSYAILEAHQAEVTVDSELGVGTTFNISFPISS